jgi:hypothetical protein
MMPTAVPVGLTRPDPHTPKTLGVLNIGFALGLMAGGLCMNTAGLSGPLLSYFAGMQNVEMIAHSKSRQAKIEKLQELESKSSDQEAKSGIQAELEELEAEPAYDPTRLTMLSNPRFRDPRLIGHFVLDLGTGLILNLFMLASGIGLYLLKRWGRVLAIMVAWAKILRLLALALSVSFVIAPLVASMITEFEAALPMEGVEAVGQRAATLLMAFSWAMFVFGSIYPIVTLVLLRRPDLKAALGVSGGRES